MKRLLFLLILCVSISYASFGEDAREFAKAASELTPSKNAKKTAKSLKKDGWMPIHGDIPLENQVQRGMTLQNASLDDNNFSFSSRFIIGTGIGKAKNYQTAYTIARNNAQLDIAALLGADVAMETYYKIHNYESDNESVSEEDFIQQSRSFVTNHLNDLVPTIAIFRQLPDNTIEVQVSLALDKTSLLQDVAKE